MANHPTSLNDDGIFEPFQIDQVPWEEFAHGERFGMRYQHLSSYGGGTQISISNEILAPGKQANGAHFHMVEEEHLLVLEGSLTLRLGPREFVMSAGHFVCFPAGQKIGHAIYNHTTVPCRYLIIGNPQPHDVAVQTESGRVSVKILGEGYRQSSKMDYWEGIQS